MKKSTCKLGDQFGDWSIIDETTFKFLSEEQQKQLLDFSDGDYILLTNENSRGFVEGMYECRDIILEYYGNNKEKLKDN